MFYLELLNAFDYLLDIIYVTGEMDPSVGSVSPGPNLTGGMEPRMNVNI